MPGLPDWLPALPSLFDVGLIAQLNTEITVVADLERKCWDPPLSSVTPTGENKNPPSGTDEELLSLVGSPQSGSRQSR